VLSASASLFLLFGRFVISPADIAGIGCHPTSRCHRRVTVRRKNIDVPNESAAGRVASLRTAAIGLQITAPDLQVLPSRGY
jgi:hypothetical protein